ncbi:hypothetical protein DENSPDRAFT_886258 [Dentipellis sp. KUC8613]|nr:hypothetical protein DENSPDRAFT_886258 [Dentipellis sp. KUC8613]
MLPRTPQPLLTPAVTLTHHTATFTCPSIWLAERSRKSNSEILDTGLVFLVYPRPPCPLHTSFAAVRAIHVLHRTLHCLCALSVALRRPLPPSRSPPPCTALSALSTHPSCTLRPPTAPLAPFAASARRMRPPRATHAVDMQHAQSLWRPRRPATLHRPARALDTPFTPSSRPPCTLHALHAPSACRTRRQRAARALLAALSVLLHHIPALHCPPPALCAVQPPSAPFNRPLRRSTALRCLSTRPLLRSMLPSTLSVLSARHPAVWPPSSPSPRPPHLVQRLHAPSPACVRHPPPPCALFAPSSPSPPPPHALLAVDALHALPPSRTPARLIAVFMRPLPSHLPTASFVHPSASPPPLLPSFARCHPLTP